MGGVQRLSALWRVLSAWASGATVTQRFGMWCSGGSAVWEEVLEMGCSGGVGETFFQVSVLCVV